MDQSPVPQTSWYMALIQGTTAIPKSVAKLLDTIGDQIGLFLEPIHIRRKGQAEADVLVFEANAKAEISVLKVENRLAIKDRQDRAAERVRKKEEKRQANLEAIASKAAGEIPQAVSDVPVDEDWVTQFFEHCQDVSSDQMQTVWARLLAGEVSKPGSFSLKTLSVVRIMSKEDANLFTRFCSMVWQLPNGLTPIIPSVDKVASLTAANLGFAELVRLDALGLIRFEAVAGFSLKFTSDVRLPWYYYSRLHILSKKDARQIDLGNALLTDVGTELAVIAGAAPDEQYRNWVVSSFREKGWDIVEADPQAAPKGNDHPGFSSFNV